MACETICTFCTLFTFFSKSKNTTFYVSLSCCTRLLEHCPTDPAIIVLQLKKEINTSKTYSPPGRHAGSGLNKGDDMTQPPL